jgi:serine/threonine protein kinase
LSRSVVSTVIDNRYRLVRQLGVGGMGVVWEAEHVGVGRRVAVKLLHKTILERDASMLSRLQREARLAGSLDSPYIASVIDTGVDASSGSPYLVLEYLVGEDLQTLITRAQKLPTELALKIAAQACLGLKKAHEAKIIHRDVKPANMFLSRRDGEITIKILDFGIAKLRPDELASLENAALTRTGSLIGSPLYMSPEQARGMKTIDQRADVWSLGVVMFNMLTGRTPYESIDALGELILAICSTASPSVRDYAPEVPIEVAEIVQKALQISPTERFQDAGAMYEAIAKHIAARSIHESALADFPEPPPGSRRFIVPTPAGPSGTEVLPESAELKHPQTGKSDPAVALGSVSMTVASPTTDPMPDAKAKAAAEPSASRPLDPAITPPPDTTKSAIVAPSGAPSGGGSPVRIVGAVAALAAGAAAAWFLFAGPSGGEAATKDVGASAAGTGTPAPSVSPVTPEPVPTVTAVLTSTAAETTTAPSASAPAPSTSATAAPPPIGGSSWSRPKPVPSTTATAKPVDTSGFGDRK